MKDKKIASIEEDDDVLSVRDAECAAIIKKWRARGNRTKSDQLRQAIKFYDLAATRIGTDDIPFTESFFDRLSGGSHGQSLKVAEKSEKKYEHGKRR